MGKKKFKGFKNFEDKTTEDRINVFLNDSFYVPTEEDNDARKYSTKDADKFEKKTKEYTAGPSFMELATKKKKKKRYGNNSVFKAAHPELDRPLEEPEVDLRTLTNMVDPDTGLSCELMDTISKDLKINDDDLKSGQIPDNVMEELLSEESPINTDDPAIVAVNNLLDDITEENSSEDDYQPCLGPSDTIDAYGIYNTHGGRIYVSNVRDNSVNFNIVDMITSDKYENALNMSFDADEVGDMIAGSFIPSIISYLRPTAAFRYDEFMENFRGEKIRKHHYGSLYFIKHSFDSISSEDESTYILVYFVSRNIANVITDYIKEVGEKYFEMTDNDEVLSVLVKVWSQMAEQCHVSRFLTDYDKVISDDSGNEYYNRSFFTEFYMSEDNEKEAVGNYITSICGEGTLITDKIMDTMSIFDNTDSYLTTINSTNVPGVQNYDKSNDDPEHIVADASENSDLVDHLLAEATENDADIDAVKKLVTERINSIADEAKNSELDPFRELDEPENTEEKEEDDHLLGVIRDDDEALVEDIVSKIIEGTDDDQVDVVDEIIAREKAKEEAEEKANEEVTEKKEEPAPANNPFTIPVVRK